MLKIRLYLGCAKAQFIVTNQMLIKEFGRSEKALGWSSPLQIWVPPLKGQTRPIFVYFRSFHTTNIAQILLDCVLGTQTRGGRMVGANESTELWRNP